MEDVRKAYDTVPTREDSKVSEKGFGDQTKQGLKCPVMGCSFILQPTGTHSRHF